MPQPEGAQLNFGYSPILTKVGLDYLPDLTQFAASSLIPEIPVASPVGLYNVWKQGDFLRRQGKRIANYEAVPLGGFAGGQQSFVVENWGLGTPYTDRDLANARRSGTPSQKFKNLKTRFVMTQAMLEKEFRVRDLIQTTANWTTTIGGLTSTPVLGTSFVQWDQAAATPVDDVLMYKRRMRLLTGFTPNTMVIPELVMLALRRNTQVIQRITPGFYGAGRNAPVEVSVDQIRVLFELDKIVTPISVYNSAAEGQTDVITDIWSNTMWLGYMASAPSTEEPSAAYTFNWTGDNTDGLPDGTGAGPGPNNMGSVKNDMGVFVREYPQLDKAAMVIEGMIWGSPNVVGKSLGMTWTAPIAP